MYEDAYPQLPPVAFGAGAADLYSMNQNVSNPYAHLDRAQQPPQETGYYSNLDRSGSQGSQSNSNGSHGGYQQQHQLPPQQFAHQDSFQSSFQDEGEFDTAGRPGTAEGRSGTPDLPNMQQTYVMNGGNESNVGHNNGINGRESVLSSSNGDQSREVNESQTSSDPFNETPINVGKANVSHQLSVRNLMPNPHDKSQPSTQRPLSTVSSVADPDDIYGGIY